MACFIICYDIADPRRLQRVHRKAVSHAQFVQYSVYYLDGSRQQLQAMLDEIEAVLDLQADDVRAYSVVPLSEATCLGQPLMPDDVYLV